MSVLIVNSEEEYLDLITDLSNCGIHEPNTYSNMDEDGMSVCDRFNKLDSQTAEDYLCVRDYEYKNSIEIDKGGEEWLAESGCGAEPLKREALHICPMLKASTNTPTVPEQEDYPILIMWE